MQDLSKLAVDSMWCTSQAGGNRQSSNELAQTAAGSPPVDPELELGDQSDPHVSDTANIPLGTSGKPQASGQTGAYKPGPPVWSKTTIPNVVRVAVATKNDQKAPRT